MNNEIRLNLAHYLCQRFYCQPTGRELSCALGFSESHNNLSALVSWINKLYLQEHSSDLLWWEQQLQKHLESKGFQLCLSL
ncbi:MULTISPECIES: hypothetical protein [unclassified Shewanella]|uniref:hypothetical protein n=1 Tax=unclassified Shewanella TaxID=196818 RepID=UPI000C84C7A3|nr:MULTISPECIES: hypothetical protein [unclassified Shewanella]MDO6639743.1 hypothetical protein [Shewanella sp. 5_MG-2023]PMG46977.1 hypothetical protein BCU91_19380 [Shewanella sp. 10N.286.52.B9]